MTLAIGAPTAGASVTLGQLGPNTATCSSGPGADLFPVSVASGSGYQVPEAGTITSWSNNSAPGAGQTLTLKVFRKVTEPDIYRVVGRDGPRPLGNGVLSTFSSSVSVQAGDLIGYNNSSSANTSCTFPPPTLGDSMLVHTPGLADGDAASFMPSSANRLNLTATFVPSNSVTVGATILNKKKGTATLNLTLPNPGELTATGSGASAASAGRAVISKAVGAGPAQLLVKAKGKKRKTLNATGKVKLSLAITYTPTGGDAATQRVTVKLKKK